MGKLVVFFGSVFQGPDLITHKKNYKVDLWVQNGDWSAYYSILFVSLFVKLPINLVVVFELWVIFAFQPIS